MAKLFQKLTFVEFFLFFFLVLLNTFFINLVKVLISDTRHGLWSQNSALTYCTSYAFSFIGGLVDINNMWNSIHDAVPKTHEQLTTRCLPMVLHATLACLHLKMELYSWPWAMFSFPGAGSEVSPAIKIWVYSQHHAYWCNIFGISIKAGQRKKGYYHCYHLTLFQIF